MGKAIAFASVLVFCSFAFVFVQLWSRRPAGAAPVRSSPQVLDTRRDGTVYAVSLEIQKFEKRLADEEKRWLKLQADLDAMRDERDDLRAELDTVQSDVRRLRRQLAERQPTARPAPPAANAPVEPTPVPVPDAVPQ